MITTRTTILGTVVLVGLSFISEDATASSYGRIAGIAERIQNDAAVLNQEFRLHYAHVPGYRQLLAKSKYIFLGAQHIRVLAYNRGSAYFMVNDAQVIDRSHHSLQHVIRKVDLIVDQGQFGHIHGRAPHVHLLMTRIASDSQYLRAEIAALALACRNSHVTYYQRPGRITKKKPAQNYGEIRSGWTRTLGNLAGAHSRGNKGSRSNKGSRKSLNSR